MSLSLIAESICGSKPHRLKDLHIQLKGVQIGGEDDATFNHKATGDSYHFPNAIALLRFRFLDRHQLSRAAAKDLKITLSLRNECGDSCFNPGDIPMHDDNIIALDERYMPLALLIKRESRQTGNRKVRVGSWSLLE